jgi:hypothetical protein
LERQKLTTAHPGSDGEDDYGVKPVTLERI